jgi:hypothetical protein
MLFGIPESMPAEHYAPGSLNLYFFIAFMIILWIFGVIFLLKSRKQDVEGAKRIQLAFGLFGIFYGLCRFFFILMFQDFTNPDQNYDLIASIAYSCGIIGFTSIIWALEKLKYEKNYFFMIGLAVTIITLGGTVVVIIAPELRTTLLLVIFIGVPISALIIFILYIFLIRKSIGVVRKKAIYSLTGLIIMFVGIVMDSQFFLAIEEIPLWVRMDLVPIVCIVGYLIFTLTQL